MTKLEISGAARLMPFLLGFALCVESGAATDSSTLELPSTTVTGKKAASKFRGIRDRSKDVLEFRARKKSRDPNVIAEFVNEGVIPGAQIWMYPAGAGYPLPGMTDAYAHQGRTSLEVVLKADSYSGGAVCSPAPINITPYVETGMLEFWVRGAQGQEVFSIGLLDNGNNAMGRPLQVWVSSRSYSKVTKDGWRRIRVPLKAFGARGSYWSEELGARISSELNRTSISCFSFDIDKERHKSFKIWMDDVRFYKVAPKGESAGGVEYAFLNEDFQDFPASAHSGASASDAAAIKRTGKEKK
jgi:hypothetical protein